MSSLSSKYDFCEYCYADLGVCSCTEKVERLKRFFGRVKNKVFVKNDYGEFYRCDHSDVIGAWSYGPTCGRMISIEAMHLSEGSAIDINHGSVRSFCKDHIPKCYLSFNHCDFYRCDVCYREKCNTCSNGTCTCPDIL